jgi:nucleoside-diphosphate-sugar epimerase
MQNKRVLATGGAGFISSNLANRLAEDNDVIAVDDTYLGTAKNLDDDFPADTDPVYIECPFDGYVQDTMADYSTFHEATGWEPEIGFEKGVELVCGPYVDENAA